MKKKIIGIFVCMLLIASGVLPLVGIGKESNADDGQSISVEFVTTVEHELDLVINPSDPSKTSNLYDPYEIYEGQHLEITITGRWYPPNPTKTICLWVNVATLPAGATFTPECHCAPGEVVSTFEWTPSVGQAGTYVVIFHLGETCGVPLGTFSITIIVHPAGQDDPPLVVIQSPSDGTAFSAPDITLTGYATDNIGIVSIGSHHEWAGDEAMTSGTIPTTTYYSFTWNFELHDGWNRITIFVYDTIGQYGEDQITVYYYLDTVPPVVVIQSPQDGSTVYTPDITVEGYATDNVALISFGRRHEWTGGDEAISGTFPPPGVSFYEFEEDFTLYEGWNRLTIFVSDVAQEGSDSVVITYIINSPPNKPACSYDSISDKLSITATDPDGDKVRYGVSWNNNQNVDQWTGLVNSGTQQKVDCGGRTGTVGIITEDEHGAQSDWVSQKSKNKAIDHSFLQFFEHHPHLFPLLRQLLGL